MGFSTGTRYCVGAPHALTALAAHGPPAHMGRMQDLIAETVVPPAPREYPRFNWQGFKTLYLREIRRFLKVGAQTLAAPVVTALDRKSVV